MAYVNIQDSPVAYLLSQSHREEICSRVNRALLGLFLSSVISQRTICSSTKYLEYHGHPPLTNLEAITKSAIVSLEEAACVGQAACSLLNIDELLSV